MLQPAFFIRQDHAVPQQDPEEHHLEHDHGSQELRLIERVPGRHDLHRHRHAEFIEHGDWKEKDNVQYIVLGQKGSSEPCSRSVPGPGVSLPGTLT